MPRKAKAFKVPAYTKEDITSVFDIEDEVSEALEVEEILASSGIAAPVSRRVSSDDYGQADYY